jgi:hypothetical protein
MNTFIEEINSPPHIVRINMLSCGFQSVLAVSVRQHGALRKLKASEVLGVLQIFDGYSRKTQRLGENGWGYFGPYTVPLNVWKASPISELAEPEVYLSGLKRNGWPAWRRLILQTLQSHQSYTHSSPLSEMVQGLCVSCESLIPRRPY